MDRKGGIDKKKKEKAEKKKRRTRQYNCRDYKNEKSCTFCEKMFYNLRNLNYIIKKGVNELRPYYDDIVYYLID